jgi:hypothetical protein
MRLSLSKSMILMGRSEILSKTVRHQAIPVLYTASKSEDFVPFSSGMKPGLFENI